MLVNRVLPRIMLVVAKNCCACVPKKHAVCKFYILHITEQQLFNWVGWFLALPRALKEMGTRIGSIKLWPYETKLAI